MVKKCLWCNEETEHDESMFQFCDNCIEKLERLEYELGNRKLTSKVEEILKRREK